MYIREAHPDDEWQMNDNETDALIYDQPRTLEERITIARDFVRHMQYTLPIVVDDIDDAAERAFAAWPERIYIVNSDGTIGYKGDVGPEGFLVNEVDEWLQDNRSLATPADDP